LLYLRPVRSNRKSTSAPESIGAAIIAETLDGVLASPPPSPAFIFDRPGAGLKCMREVVGDRQHRDIEWFKGVGELAPPGLVHVRGRFVEHERVVNAPFELDAG
jgi:hypothetical protein